MARGRKASREDCIEAIREAVDRVGHVPTIDEFNAADVGFSEAPLVNRFGTYTAAIRAAGFEPVNPNPREFTKADCLEAVVDVGVEFGRPPTIAEYHERVDAPHFQTVIKRWGSWNAVKHAIVALPPHEDAWEYSQADCLRAVCRVADDLGRPPTMAEYDARVDTPHSQAVIERWGSWSAVTSILE